jgi:hypothetical protein
MAGAARRYNAVMTSPVTRGARDLRRLLREQTCDVRTLDLAGFRRWLAGHRAH